MSADCIIEHRMKNNADNDDANPESEDDIIQEYGNEVIGREVEIYFLAEDDDDRQGQYYKGTVKDIRSTEDTANDDDGEKVPINEHYIIFDDGDSKWFHLKYYEDVKELCWVGPHPQKDLQKKASLKQAAQDQKAKAVEGDSKKAAALKEGDMNGKVKVKRMKEEELKEEKAKRIKTEKDSKVKVEKIKVDKDSKKAAVKQEDDNPKTRSVKDLIYSANLDNLESITAIIRFMDEIEPGNGYFERLQDNRNEFSSTRRKLRDIAKNKDHPDSRKLSFWVKNKAKGIKPVWKPPNHNILLGVIQLLKNVTK